MKVFLSKLIKENIHVSLTNGQLSVKVPNKGVDPSIIEEIKSRKQDLITYLSNLKNNHLEVIPVEVGRSDYPLTEQQLQIWMACQFKNGSEVFKMQKFIEFGKEFAEEEFKTAIRSVIDRHDILRTIFVKNEEGIINQKIISKKDFDFTVYEEDFTKREDPYSAVEQYMYNDLRVNFDLETGPLLKVCVFKVSEEKFVVYYSLHHIICDGWSLEVLAKDVLHYYKSDANSAETKLPDLDIQFKDYALWQAQKLEENTISKKYWITQLKGELPKLNMTIANDRPKQRTFEGNSSMVRIEKDVLIKIKQIAEEKNTTLFMNLLSIASILLYKYSFQTDQVLGTSMSGRLHHSLNNLIGCFVNSVPLRFDINEEQSFIDFLIETKNIVLNGREHQEYPINKIIKELDIKRDTSRSPVFDVMIVMLQETFDVKSNISLPSIELDASSKYDLTFYFNDLGEELQCTLLYNSVLFNKSDIDMFLADFSDLAKSLDNDVNLKISDLITSISDVKELEEYDSFLETVNNSIGEDF